MKQSRFILPIIMLALMISGCSIKAGTVTPDPEEINRDDIFVLSLPEMNPEENLHLFDYDQESDLDIREINRSQPERGITVFDLNYASANESRVPAYLIVPDGQGPFAGIILMHGGARSSNREDFLWTGSQYAKYGAVVIIIDAPWNRPEFGPGLVPARSSPTPQTFTEYDRNEQIQLIIDLRRAVDLLSTRSDIDPERIAYIGVSYGGTMGGLLAGVEDRIQAYVLVVGDGGLVTHYSDPYELVIWPIGAFYRLDEKGRQSWLDAMWPIEPIHYVSHAAPAALLFQNGTKDTAVPPFDAYRFQEAGSDPKEILWYESGHDLPQRANFDRLIWLQEYIGSADLIFMAPNYRPTARITDLLVLVWVLLTVFGMIYATYKWIRLPQGLWWVNLVWIFAIALFGPFGFLTFLAHLRQPGSLNKSWRKALGATLYTLVGYTLIFIIVLALLINGLLALSSLGSLLLLYCLPILIGLVIFRAPLLSSRSGVGYLSAIRQSLIPEVISVNSAFVGMAIAASLLLNLWMNPMDLTLRSTKFWITMVFSAFAGLIINYPFSFWMTRNGFTAWPGSPAGEVETMEVPTLRKTWAALLVSFIPVILSFLVNFI